MQNENLENHSRRRIKIPEKFMGKPIKGAMAKVLAEAENPVETINEPQNTTENPKSGYIYIPSVNIFIAKERTHLGANWYDCHKQLHEENLLMPTIPQFLAYINYLKANPNGTSLGDASKQEIESILDDILTVRNPWRAEWFDAKFEKKGEKLYINYNHRTDSNGNLIPKNSELLEDCLMEDCYADILNPNKKGLPLIKLAKDNGGIYYWYPRENYVAGFCVDSGGAGLYCDGDPSCGYSGLGVFASVPKAHAP